MGDFKINEKTVFTQSGSAEPAMGSTITDIPAAGITGAMASGVTTIPAAGITGTIPSGVSLASATFPAGHIIYFDNFNFTSTGAVSDPGTSLIATSLTITVPAATANICDKIYVSVSNACIIATAGGAGGNLSIGYFKIARTAPSSVDLALFNQLGVSVSCYPNTTMCGVDESLSNADHTYVLYYGSGTQSVNYSGNITYHGQSGMKVSISAMGIK